MAHMIMYVGSCEARTVCGSKKALDLTHTRQNRAPATLEPDGQEVEVMTEQKTGAEKEL